VCFRLRHHLGTFCRRLTRPNKRERIAVAEGYSMEEGFSSNGYTPSTPSSAFARPFNTLRRLLSSLMRSRPPPLITNFGHKSFRNGHALPRISPTRSYSLPNGYPSHTTASNSPQYLPPSPSPSPGFDDNSLSNSLTSLSSRSRNASQINLTSLVPRSGNISRVNSSMNIASGGSFHDDSE